jgi:hypothetical protein
MPNALIELLEKLPARLKSRIDELLPFKRLE